MKLPITGFLAFWLLAGAGFAQIVIPGQPGKFKGRAIGGGASGNVEVVPKETPKVRHTSYIVLAPTRAWTSSEGKTIEASLIAFEDIVVEVEQGAAAPAAPEPPAHPTVVRAGKIRLFLNRKPLELPLTRLSAEDQDFVEGIRLAHLKKSPHQP